MVQTMQSQLCVVTLLQDTRPLIYWLEGLMLVALVMLAIKHISTEQLTNQEYQLPLDHKAG